jgi:hypothetical protein
MGTMSVGRARITALVLVGLGVAAALAAPVLCTGQVRAQESVASAPMTPVAVVDFLNRSDYGGDALGRGAADALALALDESKRFTPVPRSEVEQALSRLGFSLPMSRPAQGRLAETLEVPFVASGTINDLHFEQTREGRMAVADVTVVLLSADSGEYVNGARVRQQSTPKPGYAADNAALADEALTLATYDAVRTMISYRYPEATVLSGTPTDVYLNAGSNSGLRDGMELVILRFGDKVGRVRVTRVEPEYATAAIIASYRGIAAGDKALPVFEAPTAAQAVAVRGAKGRNQLSSSLLGLAAAVGIFTTMYHHSPADVAVPDVVASSLSDASDSGSGGVLVTWSPPAHEWRSVRLYEIYRNNALIWAQPAQQTFSGSGTFFIDSSDAILPGFYSLSMSIDQETGEISEYSFATAEEGDTAPDVTPGESVGMLFDYVPPAPGEGYAYRIVAVVASVEFAPTGTTPTPTPTTAAAASRTAAAVTDGRSANSGRQAPERQYWLRFSPYANGSGVATALTPPPLLSPVQDAAADDASAVRFSWSAVAGATEYVLQISRDVRFLAAGTKQYPAVESMAPDGTEMSSVINVAADFPPASGGVPTVLYWRIGARNARDTVAPRTEPALFQTNPQDQGYVWSTPAFTTFTISSSVTAAKAADGHRGPRPLRWLGPRP